MHGYLVHFVLGISVKSKIHTGKYDEKTFMSIVYFYSGTGTEIKYPRAVQASNILKSSLFSYSNESAASWMSECSFHF